MIIPKDDAIDLIRIQINELTKEIWDLRSLKKENRAAYLGSVHRLNREKAALLMAMIALKKGH